MAHEALVNAYLATLKHDQDRSRLELGGIEVSFHCDKFNTRILKNFEDVMGYHEGGKVLASCAEATTYEALRKFLGAGEAAAIFAPLPLGARLEAIFELFKVLAYGAVETLEASPEGARFMSRTSYLAEGWLENKERWHLDEREGPACHDIRGHLAAAMAIATGKPQGSFKVQETKCRAFKGADVCEFVVEVN